MEIDRVTISLQADTARLILVRVALEIVLGGTQKETEAMLILHTKLSIELDKLGRGK